jgi:hypothetical protein
MPPAEPDPVLSVKNDLPSLIFTGAFSLQHGRIAYNSIYRGAAAAFNPVFVRNAPGFCFEEKKEDMKHGV